MKSRLYLLVGTCVAAAGTMILHRPLQMPTDRFGGGSQPRQENPSAKRISSSPESTRSPVAPRPNSQASVSSDTASQTVSSGQVASAPQITLVQEFDPDSGAPRKAASRQLLEERAKLVESEANRDLKSLLPLLNLTPAEQDRIFTILVATSPHFELPMNVGSNRTIIDRIRTKINSGADLQITRLEEIYETVDEADQIELADSYIEKEEWWTNIVADLESELDDAELPSLDPPVLLAAPSEVGTTTDDEISVTRPVVFPSE